MLEVVLDTNVLVAAFRSKQGASHQLFRMIGQDSLRLNLSVALALEYEDVLNREHLLGDIGKADIDAFLNYLFRVSNLVPFVLPRRPRLPDPDDERILEVAAACGALIVTHNTRHFVGVEQFGIAVKTPAETLKILRDRS